MLRQLSRVFPLLGFWITKGKKKKFSTNGHQRRTVALVVSAAAAGGVYDGRGGVGRRATVGMGHSRSRARQLADVLHHTAIDVRECGVAEICTRGLCRYIEKTKKHSFPQFLEIVISSRSSWCVVEVVSRQSRVHPELHTDIPFPSALVKQLLGIAPFWIDDFQQELDFQESHADILPIKIWKLF